jgi:methyltransferase (TIGR00027 family)
VDSSPIKNVTDTAFMVAAWRARETERPDALFRDPLASRLAGERGRQIVESLPPKTFMGGWSIIIRTRIIDRFIEDAVANGIDTILNLGAGLDTRPYRMELPAPLRWIEVDVPAIIDHKEKSLAAERPRCSLERVALDLAEPKLRAAFLSRTAASSKNILVLTEGVIPYLREEEVAALADDLRSAPSYRCWVADYFSPRTYAYRRRRGITQIMANAPFRFKPADYFRFFAERGWTPKEIRYLAEESLRLHRPPPLPFLLKLRLRIFHLIIPSERFAETRRFMGYVLFEPGQPK